VVAVIMEEDSMGAGIMVVAIMMAAMVEDMAIIMVIGAIIMEDMVVMVITIITMVLMVDDIMAQDITVALTTAVAG